MLAGHYASSRRSPGLRRLLIANSPSSVPLYGIGVDTLLNQFPPDFVQMVRKHEAEGTTNAQEYQDAMMTFYKKHVCTTDPWPEVLVKSFAVMEANPAVYSAMYDSPYPLYGWISSATK